MTPGSAPRRRLRRFRKALGQVRGALSRLLVPRGTADQHPEIKAALSSCLESKKRPKIAVITRTDRHPMVARLRAAWPSSHIVSVDPSEGESALHVALAAGGRFDAMLDVAADGRTVERIQLESLHLAKGAVLVVGDLGRNAGRGGDVAGQLAESESWRASGRTAVFDNGTLVVSARQNALAKIRDEELEPFLARRGRGFGQVIVRRAGSVVENPAPIVASESASAITYRNRFEAPPLSLREYTRPRCSTGQVVSKANVLLPDTYRRIAWPHHGNMFTVEVAPRFATVKRVGQVTDVDGDWFHLDSEYRGHYGHAMTEQLSRLWAWRQAKERYPDLKALLLVTPWRSTLNEWEYELYGAAGIGRDDLVLFDHAVRPERLLGATPMFCQPSYVHAGIREIYRTVGDALAAQAPMRTYDDRIFCSRRHDKRAATNTAEVEAFFASLGFAIVYPEDYPMAEQVQMFRAATEIAGFGGSAMFTMAFDPEPKRICLVNAETYKAQNEAMIAAVQGHQLNVAWCRPELGPEGASLVRDKTQSRFTFDIDRQGRFLQEILG